jgi:hypothetical protein
MLGIPNDWYRWDALRKLGNQRLVQLTVLVPIVGYLILLNKKMAGYYALYFDAEPAGISYRLYCLYFGFSVLGVASLVFSWFCPRLVKEYGSAAAFVAAEERITSPRRLSEMLEALLASRRSLPQVPMTDPKEAEWKTHDYEEYLHELAEVNPQLLMTEFFVPLKDTMPRARFTVFALYGIGFAILAVPTVEVFVRVLLDFFL